LKEGREREGARGQDCRRQEGGKGAEEREMESEEMLGGKEGRRE
jgi:hypothetical protein